MNNIKMEEIIKYIQTNEKVLLYIDQRIKELMAEDLKLSTTNCCKWKNIPCIIELTEVKLMVLGEQ